MSFFSRLLNLAGGKISDLGSKDESLSDERLASELDAIQTKPSAAAQAELTLRKQAPTKSDADDGTSDEPDDDGPVRKTL